MRKILSFLIFVLPINTMVLNVVSCGENNDATLEIDNNLDYLNAFKLAFGNYKTNLIDNNPSEIDLTSDSVDMSNDGYFSVIQNFCDDNSSYICTYTGKKITNDEFRNGSSSSTDFTSNQISNIQFALDEIAKKINLATSNETNYQYDFSNYLLTEDYSNLKYFLFGIQSPSNNDIYEVKIIGQHSNEIKNNKNISQELQTNSMIENNFENLGVSDFIKSLSKTSTNNLFSTKNVMNFSSLGFYSALFNENLSNNDATLNLQYNLAFNNFDTENNMKLYNYNLQNIINEFVNFVQENYLFNSSATQNDFINYSNEILNNFGLSISVKAINSSKLKSNLSDNFTISIQNLTNNFSFEKEIKITKFIDETNEEENINSMILLLNEKYKIDSYNLGISYEEYLKNNDMLITKLSTLLNDFFPREIYTVSISLLNDDIEPNQISQFKLNIKNNINNIEFNKEINFSLNSLQEIKNSMLENIINTFKLYFVKNNDINFTMNDEKILVSNVVLEFKNKEFFKFFKLNEVGE
ncbi:hypothetical protein [Spiroplasma endosymbiont of Labia minor]|uniref:hypothetical protein n=1 Tax=Spiroplasma endosymbiont of Labia minor TaxID=3066305 RepID=UPI0030D05063